MELKLNCEASIKLEKFNTLVKIECNIGEYTKDKDTINGLINIEGVYLKDDLDNKYDFLETVPYSVILNTENYDINKINVTEIKNNEIFNYGLDITFDINIEYDVKDIIKEEITNDNNSEETIDESIKNDITEKYDNLLSEILNGRIDDVIEEETIEKIEPNNTVINSVTENQSSEVRFTKFIENYSSYKVYYPNQEKEIEKICNKENISIDKIYKNKFNNDFSNKKRIIIK